MRKRFCPKCGVPIEKGVLCTECNFEEIKVDTILVQISEFNRTFHKGSWHYFNNLDDVLVKRVRDVFGKDVEVDIEPFEFEPKPKEKIIIKAKVFLEDQELEIPIKLSYMQCDYGQKEKTNYFEGILQLQNTYDEVFVFIESEMKRLASRGVFITKTVETKTGADLYMTNKTQMRLLGQKIISKFGGEVILNPQLFSHNHLTSKDIYRLNVLVKIAPFKAGQVIEFERYSSRGKLLKKEFMKVKKMGKLIQGFNLETGKHDALELRYMKNIKIIPVEKSSVIAIKPELSVLNPQTYQESIPQNKNLMNEFAIDEKLNVVITSKGIFIVD